MKLPSLILLSAAYWLALPSAAHSIVEAETQPLPEISALEANWMPTLNSKTYQINAPFVEEFKPTFKPGGYIIGKYQATDQQKATASTFDIRLMRLYAQGFVARDFYYRFQMEVNRSPGIDRGPRVLDAFIEWQKYASFQIKLGQFKRAFGFENPMSPLAVGLGAMAQSTIRLQSINDRIGEHPSSGRDVGLQVAGDLLRLGHQKHPLLHYQVGLYNGQGINHLDVNNHKDLIAGLWLSPVKNLAIGVFGWEGRYQRGATKADGSAYQQIANRHRYALGVKYESDWSFRAEYVHSRGGTLTKPQANHSDGWYATVGIPVSTVKGLKIYGRWDCYRDDANTWAGLKTNWAVAANYWLNKKLLFQLNLIHTDDRALSTNRHYNTLDAQIVARF